MNWLQTNGVIYLPVIVKGARRVFAFWRAGDRGSKQTRHIHPMLKQCSVSVADSVPTVYQHWVNVSCLLGLHSQQTHLMSNPALQLLGQRRRRCANFDPALR